MRFSDLSVDLKVKGNILFLLIADYFGAHITINSLQPINGEI